MGTNSGATAGINNKPVGGATGAGVLVGGGVGGANSSIGGVLSNSLGGGGSGGLSISGLNAGGQNANVGGMGNVGGDDGGNGMVGGGVNNQQATTPQYTIPGILHFIQHEWSRFELERSQWDVDRAELQVSYPIIYFERERVNQISA